MTRLRTRVRRWALASDEPAGLSNKFGRQTVTRRSRTSSRRSFGTASSKSLPNTADGYRPVTDILRMEGWHVGRDAVYTIWREEGLKVPQKQPKRARLYLADGSCIRLRPKHKNHVWSPARLSQVRRADCENPWSLAYAASVSPLFLKRSTCLCQSRIFLPKRADTGCSPYPPSSSRARRRPEKHTATGALASLSRYVRPRVPVVNAGRLPQPNLTEPGLRSKQCHLPVRNRFPRSSSAYPPSSFA